MVHPYLREPEFITQLKDGTVKQLNPFSGTEVWTVAGRGNRPMGVTLPDPVPLDPDEAWPVLPLLRGPLPGHPTGEGAGHPPTPTATGRPGTGFRRRT